MSQSERVEELPDGESRVEEVLSDEDEPRVQEVLSGEHVADVDEHTPVAENTIAENTPANNSSDSATTNASEGGQTEPAAEEPWSEEKTTEHTERALALKEEGNVAYKAHEWDRALDLYSQALEVAPPNLPQRAIFHCNKAACYVNKDLHEEVITECTAALKIHDGFIRALLRRAQAYEKVDKPDLALEDYKKLVELDPSHAYANESLVRLPPIIHEKFEREKDEMLGKLKELGNNVLGKLFGISLDNFEMKQDAETGSYSINTKSQ